MQVQAIAKYIRVSPRKLILLADSVRRQTAQQAVTQLEFINKSGAKALRQVILSALNNAKQKNVSGDMVFQTLSVHPGSAMKRFRAVSRGMAHTYKKRMSHVKVVLKTVEPKLKLKDKTEDLSQNSNVKS